MVRIVLGVIVFLGCAARAEEFPKLTLEKGQTVLVVVDGLASDTRAAPIRYTLHISEYVPRETGRCSNGADDDADGRADSADPDCR